MIAIPETRKVSMAFSDRSFQPGQLLNVRFVESEITGPGSLNGRIIGAQFGIPGALEAEKTDGVMLIAYDSIHLAFTALQNSEIDGVIADQAISLGFIHRSNGQFTVAGHILDGQDIAIAVCKTNTDLLESINSALAIIISEGNSIDWSANGSRSQASHPIVSSSLSLEGIGTTPGERLFFTTIDSHGDQMGRDGVSEGKHQ